MSIMGVRLGMHKRIQGCLVRLRHRLSTGVGFEDGSGRRQAGSSLHLAELGEEHDHHSMDLILVARCLHTQLALQAHQCAIGCHLFDFEWSRIVPRS